MTKWELGEEFRAYKMAREFDHLTYTQWLEEMAMRYLDPPGNARQPEAPVSSEVPIPTAVLSLLNQIENLTFDDDYSTAMNLISDKAKEAMALLTKGRGGV